jgi:hypothetical protein
VSGPGRNRLRAAPDRPPTAPDLVACVRVRGYLFDECDLTFKSAAATRGGRCLLNAPGCAPHRLAADSNATCQPESAAGAAFPLLRLLNQVAQGSCGNLMGYRCRRRHDWGFISIMTEDEAWSDLPVESEFTRQQGDADGDGLRAGVSGWPAGVWRNCSPGWPSSPPRRSQELMGSPLSRG